MSTVPVDKSVGKIPILTKYPAILGKVTHWLKNRQFGKPLLLRRYFYSTVTLLEKLTESLLNGKR